MPVIPPLSDHGPFLRIILGPPAKRWAMLSRVEACSSWSIRNVELELHRIDDYRYRRVTQARFAFPYLIPLTSQFAPMRDAGAKRSTMIPTKPLHSGSLLLTAFVIAISRAAREIRVRFATGSPSEPRATAPPATKSQRLQGTNAEIKENPRVGRSRG
jgi:hypothetical protein